MVDVLRVFPGPDGEHGNPLGVVLDGASVPAGERQGIAAALGYSETVFVDDRERGELEIFTPAVELPFAGHPLVGTAWLLAQEGQAPGALRPPAGEVGVRFDGELTWIAGAAVWVPMARRVELCSPAEVEALDGAPDGGDSYCWAWEDEPRGLVRARGFFPGAGIAEDEATGSAALGLAVALERGVEIHQGRGSLIHARSLGGGRGEVGGTTVRDDALGAEAARILAG
jgi:predicted PhzF superfamily epimerase YddE/YHI9